MMRYPVSALRFVTPLVQALEAQGIRAELWVEPTPGLDAFYQAIPCRKRPAMLNLGANPLRFLRATFALLRLLRQVRPGAIEAHTSRGALIPLLAARLAGIPVRIYHNHGLPYLGYRGPLRALLRALERINVLLATDTLTVSFAMRDALARDGVVEAAHCHVIAPGSACGLDLRDFDRCSHTGQKPAHKEAQGISSATFVALYVGRAHRRKGFPLLLQTWARHFAQDPTSILALAGCNAQDVRSVLGADCPENIRALGYLEDLHPWYAAADVVVLPSEHEGLPYALLEGAASACCLIASDLPGLDAIVKDGQSGYLVAIGDAAALVRKLQLLKDDPLLRERMAVAARGVAETFDRTRFLRSYLEFVVPLLRPRR